MGKSNLTQDEWLALALSVGLLLASGVWHLFGILGIRRLNLAFARGGVFSVLISFWGIALLHMSEIIVGAGFYGVAIYWLGLGEVVRGYGDSPAGLLYLSGVTYATLGYTEQVVHGPLRLMTMTNALGGFMLITWSATYVYTIWGEHFRNQDTDHESDRDEQASQ